MKVMVKMLASTRVEKDTESREDKQQLDGFVPSIKGTETEDGRRDGMEEKEDHSIN